MTPTRRHHAASPSSGVQVVSAEFLRSAHQLTDLPAQGLPELGVMGRSNVGKSSLLNFLAARRQLARVSNTPGRTRQINYFVLHLQRGQVRHPLMLVDLPGYGHAKMAGEDKARVSGLLSGYLGSGRPAAVWMLLDIRRDPEGEDVELAAELLDRGVMVIPVVTKIDKVPKHQRVLRASAITRGLDPRAPAPILTSSTDAAGREDLLRFAFDLAAGGGR